MKKHSCEVCNYSTKRMSDYIKHLKTMKHKFNHATFDHSSPKILRKPSDTAAQIHPVREPERINASFLCPYCSCEYSRLDNLKRHEGKCSKRIINEKNKELERQSERLLKCEQELHFFKQLFQLSGQKEDKSISKFKFINTNYKNAGPLKKITYKRFAKVNEIQYINDDKNNNDDGGDSDEEFCHFRSKRKAKKSYNERFIEDVLYSYRHNILDSYIGGVIVKMYKDLDPSQQSIWITDQSRLKYVIRTKDERDMIHWTADKDGKHTEKYLIYPIIKKTKKLLRKYQKKYCIPKRNVHYEWDEQERMMKDNEAIIQIIRDMDDGKLNRKILKYLATEFSVDMNKSVP